MTWHLFQGAIDDISIWQPDIFPVLQLIPTIISFPPVNHELKLPESRSLR